MRLVEAETEQTVLPLNMFKHVHYEARTVRILLECFLVLIVFELIDISCVYIFVTLFTSELNDLSLRENPVDSSVQIARVKIPRQEMSINTKRQLGYSHRQGNANIGIFVFTA